MTDEDPNSEADQTTWLEYFKIALDGTATATETTSAGGLVDRAAGIADAAVKKLKTRSP